ncbi:DUF4429 domain-containing protein [Propioniciclava flava]|uniref:SHOCT domain-containing protein n=1 Tax=Propioniciclava flava TaxID=2072026 RepID=A0A4Q2EIE7_9ACTN|nr:DUF4429 domain-containing protein [Propioniciclava flava]RXW32873.1 hypothetical protein C1706_03025 [Propioniciclava flava]
MITARGHNGTVTFDGTVIVIAREGFMARSAFGRGEKRIPIRSVSAVQLKPPGGFTNGFIQFTISGGRESLACKGNRTMAAANDENSVLFTKAQQDVFVELHDAISEALVAPTGSAIDPADQLQKLALLRDQGILSEEEFAAKKADILGRI